MSASTGRAIDGDAHLRQSITDILTTPMGSRVMRRDYGSLLPELIDQPLVGATRVRLFGAVAMALMRWEPRVRITRVQLVTAAGTANAAANASNGAFALELDIERTDTAPPTTLTQLTVPLRPALG